MTNTVMGRGRTDYTMENMAQGQELAYLRAKCEQLAAQNERLEKSQDELAWNNALLRAELMDIPDCGCGHPHCNQCRADRARKETLDQTAEAEISRRITDAERYQWLRSRPLDTIRSGGVFAGETPRNIVLNGDDLDERIDAAIRKSATPTDKDHQQAALLRAHDGGED